MKDWLFVFKDKSWYLKIDSVEKLFEYANNNKLFEQDKEHFKKIQSYDDRRSTLISHTEWGWYIKNGLENGLTIDESYAILAKLQLSSMYKVLKDKGTIFVNAEGGFRILNDYTNFVRRKKLEFPKYYRNDIRIKKFQDGNHFYAYVGDATVRDGDIVKWNTYDEAYKAASRFTRGI